MYKNRLQELCHQRMWPPPVYTSSRDGPDHNPRFRASVTVNGATFDASDLSKSSKEAQNKAAQVAVDHFASTLPSKPSSSAPLSSSGSENQISYKSQLQIYGQRKNIDPPKYDFVCEGPAHDLRFKATVTVDGQTFYSPKLFNTLKEAEHDVAKVALLSLSLDENPQDEPNFYKNLLQQLVQKEGFSLPKYDTVRDGASHMPIFSSTVVIEGESFEGNVAKTKKQAEMNAAKVAWCQLKERLNARSGRASRLPPGLSSSCSVQEDIEHAFSGSQSTAIKNSEQPKPLSVPVPYVMIKKDNGDSAGKDKEDEITGKNDSGTVNTTAILQDDQGTHLSKEILVNGDGHIEKSATSPHKLDFEFATKNEDTVEDTLSRDGISSSSTPSDFSDRAIANMNSEFPMGRATCSFLCNRVRVYPRTPDMVLPEGATLLPFSDDMWVAVSLDFSNHEDKIQEDGITVKNDSITVNATVLQDDQGTQSSEEIMVNGNCVDKSATSLHKLDFEVATMKEDAAEDTLSQDGTSSPSIPSDCSDRPMADLNSEFLMRGATCSLLCNRVRVYPHKPDMVLPEGATLLPFSDDMWVAVSLDFSNHECGVLV